MNDKEEIEYLRQRLMIQFNENRMKASIAAMQGLLSNPNTSKDLNIPKMSVVCADALLTELSDMVVYSVTKEKT